MSEQNRFFQWLYRILALAALGLIGFLAWEMVSLSFETSRWRNHDAVDVPQVAHGQPVAQRLHFSNLTTIKGTSNMFVEVRTEFSSDSRKGFSSGGSGPGPLRNLVFLSGGYGRAHWLLDRNDQILRDVVQLHESNDESKPVVAIFLELIRDDTNKDGALDEDDASIPTMTRTDGSGLTELPGHADRILEQSVNADGKRIGLLEQDGDKLLYREYAVDSFAKVSEQMVTEIKTSR